MRRSAGRPRSPEASRAPPAFRVEPGSYEYVCTVGDHAELGMKGTLKVEWLARAALMKRMSVPLFAGAQVDLVHQHSHELEAAPGLGQLAASHDARHEAPGVLTSKTSAWPSASTAIRIGSLGEEEPCWIALVTASLIASFTS